LERQKNKEYKNKEKKISISLGPIDMVDPDIHLGLL